MGFFPANTSLESLAANTRNHFNKKLWASKKEGRRFNSSGEPPQALSRNYFGNPREDGDTDIAGPSGMSGDQHAETSLLFTRFWLSAAQWMRQRVLVRSRPPSVMPKNKKRSRKLARRSKGRIPTIEIVQLRRTERGPTTGGGTSRSYSVRFIVHGHWRNQWYSRAGVHAPKWIEAYVKGPHNAPLKESLRVYDVSR